MPGDFDKDDAIAKLKETWHSRVNAVPLDPTTRALAEKATWGLAGVCVVLIAAIVSSNLQEPGMRVALTLFAACVPILVLTGVLFHWSNVPGHQTPEVAWVVKTGGLWLVSVGMFILAMIVFLAAYNLVAGFAFTAAVAYSYSRYLRFSKHLVPASPAVPLSSSTTAVAASSQPAQVDTEAPGNGPAQTVGGERQEHEGAPSEPG